jgi:hypothetical protein
MGITGTIRLFMTMPRGRSQALADYQEDQNCYA